jgi:hypothetical protein
MKSLHLLSRTTHSTVIDMFAKHFRRSYFTQVHGVLGKLWRGKQTGVWAVGPRAVNKAKGGIWWYGWWRWVLCGV